MKTAADIFGIELWNFQKGFPDWALYLFANYDRIFL